MIELVETEQGGVVILQPPVIVSAPLTAAERANAQADELEHKEQLPAAVRLFMLTAMENEAAAKGLTIEQLVAKNKMYRQLKAFDAQIAALRAQL